MKQLLTEMVKAIEELASSVDSLEQALIARGALTEDDSHDFLAQAQLNARHRMSSLRHMISNMAE